MLLHGALKGDAGSRRPLIFGTDINEESLRAAERGLYGRDKLESTKLGVLDEYFVARGDRYEVSPDIRNIVRFSRDDLTAADRLCPAESVFGGFDLVLCRNVLIYFTRELQEAVLDKLQRCLGPGGTLVLGNAEFLSGPIADRFRAIDARNRIFQKI
jgi:chemotaxis methyl-accepting protein methylase